MHSDLALRSLPNLGNQTPDFQILAQSDRGVPEGAEGTEIGWKHEVREIWGESAYFEWRSKWILAEWTYGRYFASLFWIVS